MLVLLAALFSCGCTASASDENKDAYSEEGQKISFCGLTELCDYGFIVRKAANSKDLCQIDMNIVKYTDQATAVQSATEVYRKLLQKFGSPTKSMRFYANGDFVDAQTDDIAAAIEQLSHLNADYSYLAINFNNLHFYVVRNTDQNGPYYDVEFSLVPYTF